VCFLSRNQRLRKRYARIRCHSAVTASAMTLITLASVQMPLPDSVVVVSLPAIGMAAGWSSGCAGSDVWKVFLQIIFKDHRPVNRLTEDRRRYPN